VWTQYRCGGTLPTLCFRNGLVVKHGLGDDPITLVEEVFWNRCYRHQLVEPTQGVMVDIGANIGIVALDWARRLPGVVIHAFEPYPPTFSSLATNVEGNGFAERILIHPEAIGRSSGMVALSTAGLSPQVTAYGKDFDRQVYVPRISLEAVVESCARDSSIGLLKIDAEGSEVEILEGASSDTLARIDQVVLEYHDNIVTRALSRTRAVLESARFHCFVRPTTSELGLLYARRLRSATSRSIL
jgi:FkbM family methyltransferase